MQNKSMLDSKSKTLLFAINGLCGDGYKVLTFEEVLSALPPEIVFTKILLTQILCELDLKGYISIKYQDDNEVCVATLPKTRLFFEQCETELTDKTTNKRLTFKFSFLGALCGSLIGAIITTLCLTIIYLNVK